MTSPRADLDGTWRFSLVIRSFGFKNTRVREMDAFGESLGNTSGKLKYSRSRAAETDCVSLLKFDIMLHDVKKI